MLGGRTRIERDQWLALGLYAGGGALLTLGVVTFLGSRSLESQSEHQSLRCDAFASPALGGMRCSTRF